MKWKQTFVAISGSFLAIVVTLVVCLAWTQHVLNSHAPNSIYAAEKGGSATTARARKDERLPILWKAPPFSLTDQYGKPFAATALAGKAWVADFIFTQCTSACPIMTAKMAAMQRAVTDPNVRFVSISVDPAHDTPQVLQRYATDWRPGESRWILLSTTPQTLKPLVHGMNVSAEASDDPQNPILHSNLFFLIDGQGRVRGLYNSTDDDNVKQLALDLQTLSHEIASHANGSNASAHAASTPPSAATVTDGATLFATLGCGACHNQPRLAPALGGLANTKVMLRDGRSVTADHAYILESILDPSAKIVQGFVPMMPSYRPHLSDVEAERLAAYVASLPPSETSTQTATTQAVELVVDPVCKMEVRVLPDTPEAKFRGLKFHFCSDQCREKFLRDPKSYLKTASTKPALQGH